VTHVLSAMTAILTLYAVRMWWQQIQDEAVLLCLLYLLSMPCVGLV
jgi:hypothetical protein